MITIFPNNSTHIHQAKNGFIVNVKGTIEDQEDGLDNVYVFESLSALTNFLKEHYGKEKKTE